MSNTYTLTNAAMLYGRNVADDLETGRGHISAVHLKETVPGKYRDIPYGTGHTNLAEGICTARRLGVRRFVSEFWDNGAFEAQLTHARTFLRGFLNQGAKEGF